MSMLDGKRLKVDDVTIKSFDSTSESNNANRETLDGK